MKKYAFFYSFYNLPLAKFTTAWIINFRRNADKLGLHTHNSLCRNKKNLSFGHLTLATLELMVIIAVLRLRDIFTIKRYNRWGGKSDEWFLW